MSLPENLHDKQAAVKAGSAALNRVLQTSRGAAARRTVEVFNIGLQAIRRYIVDRRASISKDGIRGSLVLRIRAIPIEEFKPRVEMRSFTYEMRGRQVTRRLPVILLQRYRAGAPKVVGPAFPLQQRRTGQLRRGDKVRRRIGTDRNKLTKIRYYTFPKKFVKEEMAPLVKDVAGARFSTEFDSAYRRFAKKTGQRVLRRNT